MDIQGYERFDYAEACKPLVEQILIDTFGFDSCQWMNNTFADMILGIDIIARIDNQPITIQSKCLSQDYKTITIETSGVDEHGHKKAGDWTTNVSQYSIYVYSFDAITAERYVIIDNAKLILANVNKGLCWTQCKNKYSYSEFKYIDVAQIVEKAPEVVIAISGEWK